MTGERTPTERYVLGAVGRREVFRDWETVDYVWPLVADPEPLTVEQATVLMRLAGDGLVVLGEKRGADQRQWWELTDKALEG